MVLILWLFLIAGMVTSACQRQNNVCQPPDSEPSPKLSLADLIAMPAPTPPANPLSVEIGGKMMAVDKLVAGPLCNDTWSGSVYVSCNTQVADYQDKENPLFLKGCALTIEPDTVIYVAAHNDAAYYKGCSCHTGQDPLP
jgi:hypothetical protein